MSDKRNGNVEFVDETVEMIENSRFFEVARKLMLAGVGAAAMAQEEMEEFVNRLVKRGEIAEKDGRKLLDELRERRANLAREASRRTDLNLEQRLETLLHRMNIPTKADIDTLSKKIASLSRKVDQLRKAQEK